MDKIFLTVLNMSFTASFVIAAIIIARLFLKKTPKIISYILWIAAGFRLVFPFSVESVLSLMPVKSQPIPSDIVTQAVPNIDTGIPAIDNAVSSILPTVSQTDSGINYLKILLAAGLIIWVGGIAVMLIYSTASVIALKLRISGVALTENNIYEANIKTPFVMGFFKPKIYVPKNLPDDERDYIILHEQIHIRRHDNFVKLIAYFILSIHWFNPFVWAAFMLMGTDMEMSCDERVLKETNGKIKKAYSMSILSLAAEKHTINIYPLAFGEGNVKRRIKNVLSFKKYSKIKIAVTLIMVIALTAGFMVNKISADNSQEKQVKDDFTLASEFLIKLHIFSEDEITNGEENIKFKEFALFFAKASTALPALFEDDYDSAIKYCRENLQTTPKDIAQDDPFTLEQAVKMLVSALNYTGLADPVGYIVKANEPSVRLLGDRAVFKFTDVPTDKILTKNEAVMLLYNYLMSDSLYLQMVFDPTNGTFKAEETLTPVYKKFEITLAKPTPSAVTVNGKKISFDSYEIENSNYFKIRDLAYILNGTKKQFDVDEYDEYTDEDVTSMVTLLKAGNPYTVIGGEMAEKKTKNITAVQGKQKAFKVDGNGESACDFIIYIINNEKYYKLRDIAETLDFSVKYDEAKDTVIIDTNKPYIQ